MSNSYELRRIAAGVPTGGQFAEKIHPEAGVVSIPELVESDDEWNADGTFAFPPIGRSPRQAIAFWLTVEIPDVVLDRFTQAYWKRADNYRAYVEGETYIPKMATKAKRAAMRAEKEQGLWTPLGLNMARPIVRLSKLKYYADESFVGDSLAAVHNCKFQLPWNAYYTPLEVVRTFGVDQISHTLNLAWS